MAAGIDQIFIATPRINWPSSVITAANTNRDGTGTVGTVFTAGSNGAFIKEIRLVPLGTNIQTVARFFINNGSDPTVASNNQLIGEVTLPATTADADDALPPSVFNVQQMLPAGYRITYCIGTAVATGFGVTAFGGDY